MAYPLTTPGGADPCLRSVMDSLKAEAASIKERLGEAAMERLIKQPVTAAIDAIKLVIQNFILVFEPVLLLDNIVFNNVIKPPLQLLISIGGKTQDVMDKPINTLKLDRGGDTCPSIRSMGVSKKLTSKLNVFETKKWQDRLNRAELWTKQNDEWLKDLGNSVTFLDEFRAEVQKL